LSHGKLRHKKTDCELAVCLSYCKILFVISLKQIQPVGAIENACYFQ